MATGGGVDEPLLPRKEQSVDFQGDLIPLAEAPDGKAYVALRPITDHLGLDASSQRRRVQRDHVMAPRLRTLALTAADGRRRDVLCLPLDLLPGFLFGIDTGRVRPALVEKLDRYRADCFDVLYRAFRGELGAVRAATVPVDTQGTALSGAALALEIATAVQHLAHQQLEMEQRLADVAGRQDVMADYLRTFLRDINQRVAALEQREREATVDEPQAAEVALAVRAIGQAYQARGDKSGYSRVYSEMYRRYAISTYHKLPAAAFDEVMAWLHGWYKEIAGDDQPASRP
jgi:hypothetical protein